MIQIKAVGATVVLTRHTADDSQPWTLNVAEAKQLLDGYGALREAVNAAAAADRESRHERIGQLKREIAELEKLDVPQPDRAQPAVLRGGR